MHGAVHLAFCIRQLNECGSKSGVLLVLCLAACMPPWFKLHREVSREALSANVGVGMMLINLLDITF